LVSVSIISGWGKFDAKYCASRGEVAGDIEDEVGGVVGEGVDLAVVGGHDRNVPIVTITLLP